MEIVENFVGTIGSSVERELCREIELVQAGTACDTSKKEGNDERVSERRDETRDQRETREMARVWCACWRVSERQMGM